MESLDEKSKRELRTRSFKFKSGVWIYLIFHDINLEWAVYFSSSGEQPTYWAAGETKLEALWKLREKIANATLSRMTKDENRA